MYFVWTTKQRITKKQAAAINHAVKQIDETMSFIGPLHIPGNDTTGWLERPNDGTNDYHFRRETNHQAREAAQRILGTADPITTGGA